MRKKILPAFAFALVAALAGNASAHQKPFQRPSPSITARFLPTRICPDDPAEVARFRALVSGLHADSTRHWSLRKGKVEITHDMLLDLDSAGGAGAVPDGGLSPGRGSLPVTSGERGRHLADFLSRKHGLRFHASGNAYADFRPDDYWYSLSPQWALHNAGTTLGDRPGKAGVDIDIEKVWDKFSGNDTLVIAVVDAGFDFKHPDLKGKNWINVAEAKGLPGVDDDKNGFVDDSLGWDFVDGDNFPQDFHGHGTYCSSVIAAGFDNGEGIAGVVPQCRIMPIRVLDASGHGNQSDIAQGIRYAIRNGAKVINFSIGGDANDTGMQNAFKAARDAGIPVVVAAGNDNLDIDATPTYPAAYPYDNIIVAAAHDHAGLMCSFSNYGKNLVDLAAPGEFVLVAGIPQAKEVWKDSFEAADLSKWAFTSGSFALTTVKPLDGKQSLEWIAGTNVTAATADYIDLSGKAGCALKMVLQYRPANSFDVLIIEGNIEGSALWNEIGIIGSVLDSANVVAFGLQDFDGTKFKLRVRTSSRVGSSGRILKLDDITVTAPDPNPATEAVYSVIGGTSIAAPHITAYLGLQRLACDRLGQPWTRTLALQGVVQEPAFTNKVATGGRLDVYKGLQFYLSTLPDLHVVDSTAVSWPVGEPVQYSLELVPAPKEAYKFSVSGLDSNVTVDGAGKFTWVPGPKDVGSHTVTVTADGPTLFRKRFDLSVQQAVPVPVAAGKGKGGFESEWRLAGSRFRLRTDMAAGRHWVEVWGTDAVGKIQLLKKAWLDASDFQRPLDLAAARTPIADIRVSVDGQQLAGIH